MIDRAAAVAKLDAGVDSYLGDPLFYHAGGIITDKPVQGFLEDPSEVGILNTDAPLDSVGIRRRLEISRLIVPNPTRNDRVTSNHALLAGSTWRPVKWRHYRGARNWLIELEKVG